MEHYTINIQRQVDDDGTVFWLAWHPALAGCMAQGRRPDEAVESLTEARRRVLAHQQQHGLPVPPGDTNMKQALIYVYEGMRAVSR